ncbi:MAG: hypothetical protein D4R48_03620 [Nitrosomonadales bacterium]|nr:MAG: hypothetical protein D4R48_03625 [Nitrosomonadales bacterium]TSA49328.1 MAG: hypothetical protein D4R48_03620 [Nitrosomonadales bacterium]
MMLLPARVQHTQPADAAAIQHHLRRLAGMQGRMLGCLETRTPCGDALDIGFHVKKVHFACRLAPLLRHCITVAQPGKLRGFSKACVVGAERRADLEQARARLFEVGATFRADNAGFAETTKLAGLCYGDAVPEQWGEPAREVDFFDVKADIERITAGRARFQAAQHPALHPGQSAQVMLDGRSIGWLGVLHPRWQQHHELPRGAVLFELELAALQDVALPLVAEVAKFPPIRRDIAVVVDETVSVQALLDAMLAEQVGVVDEIALFDQYRGKGVESGKKSLAFLVLMQDTQRTLTDEEADAAMAQLAAAMYRQCGAVLRS